MNPRRPLIIAVIISVSGFFVWWANLTIMPSTPSLRLNLAAKLGTPATQATNSILVDDGRGGTNHAPERNQVVYHLRAGGPQNYVGLTNLPASNKVDISLASSGEVETIFALTNREPHSILLWNVRVQTASTNGGTDGLGWDTVADDYPAGTALHNSASFPSGGMGEFKVSHPGKAPWRVCILYSTDWTDSGKTYSGNYEVISRVMTE